MQFRNSILRLTALFIIFLIGPCLTAQAVPLSGSKKGVAAPSSTTDPLGRGTPQGTIVGFMLSAQKGEYERALKYLDTRKTGRSAVRLIDELQVVLERGFSGKLGMLSTKAEGRLDDNLPPSKELVGTIETESDSLDVLLERVQRGTDPPIWLFASETLAKVPEVYTDLDTLSPDRFFPRFMTEKVFIWFPLWQWIYILLVAPLSFLVATLLTRLLTPFLLKVVVRVTKVKSDRHAMTLTGPLRILILALALWAISTFSHSILVSLFWTYAAITLAVVGATWLTIRLIDVVVKLKHKKWSATATGRVAMVQLVGKLSKAFTLIVGVLIILYVAGINITAALTGLGIGGVAVAFAAQKTLENLFGGIMIISDQPIRVGDFCKAGNHTGTVESIGLRSTFLRTVERTTVSIPNGQLAVMSLENFAHRDKILFHHSINVRPDATGDQLTKILAGMRNLLHEHPKIDPEAARVSLIRFSDSAFVIEVYAYIRETAYDAFTLVQEEVLLEIMGVIEAHGAGLAFPAQTAASISPDRGAEGPKP